jgi:hypothetical protein
MHADYETADYTLPVPDEWLEKADALIEEKWKPTKPLLIYRPLVARPEWRGSMVRNANPDDYAALFAPLREHFFVVSVADLQPGAEWITGPQLIADVELHHGEAEFETLAALFKRAALVYTSSGFGAILAPAVGTPCVSIVGGYEDGRAHDSGARFAPLLSIEPEKPCRCWTSNCHMRCTKKINIVEAAPRVRNFAETILCHEIKPITSDLSMFTPDPNGGPAMLHLKAPDRNDPQYRNFHRMMRERARANATGKA